MTVEEAKLIVLAEYGKVREVSTVYESDKRTYWLMYRGKRLSLICSEADAAWLDAAERVLKARQP